MGIIPLTQRLVKRKLNIGAGTAQKTRGCVCAAPKSYFFLLETHLIKNSVPSMSTIEMPSTTNTFWINPDIR